MKQEEEIREREIGKKRTGAIFIILAALFFSLMSLFVRLSGDLPTMQKAFFRNIVAVSVATGAVIKKKEGFRVKKGCFKTLLIRSSFGTAGMLLNFWVIDRLGIADANMLGKMSPFFAILLSAVLLKERVGKAEIMIVVIAMIGAVFVIKPTAGIASLPALAGLVGGFCAGMAYTYVRKLGLMGERREMIILFFSLFSTLVTLPTMIFQHEAMTASQILSLVLAGCSAAAAQFSLTYAYSIAKVRDISIYDYSQVLFAAIWGILIFSETPDIYSILGYFIIIGAAVIKWKMGREE